MSWRRARWRMRCHVRSLPPLSSGSSRSDLSQRMRMRKDLNALLVDERPIPEFEVEEAPQAIGAGSAAGRVVVKKRVDSGRIDDAALARSSIEQDVAQDGVPRAAGPHRERNRKAHLRSIEN